MASVYERMAAARQRFERAGIGRDEAAIDAEVLARHVLGWDRSSLITRGHEPAPAEFENLFEPLVVRRERREPVAMIIGHREFWNLDFEVTRDVLVPRPETELVVETAIELASALTGWTTRDRRGGCRRIIDVGTGSGCLAVALAVEFPDASVVAADISDAALSVARRNAGRHGVQDRITFVQSDVLDSVDAVADLIVSNPPYCRTGDYESLQPEVHDFEPATALLAGPDGLDVVRRLFATAASHLAEGGRLVVEFGFGQDAEIARLAEAAGWRIHAVKDDLQRIPRVIVLGR